MMRLVSTNRKVKSAYMRRRNHVDIMRAGILQAQHFIRQLVAVHCPGVSLPELLADLVILAKYTAHVAPGEKDRPGAPCSRNGRLFSEMQTGMRDRNTGTDPAKTDLPDQPVDSTVARATFTPGQLTGE